MNKQRVICYAAIVALAVALSGCASRVVTSLVEDPQGRFSFAVAEEMESRESGVDHYAYLNHDPEITVDIVVREASTEAGALQRAFAAIGYDYSALERTGAATMMQWKLERFPMGTDDGWLAVAYQYREDTVYAFIASGGADSDPDSLPASVFVSLRTFTFTERAGSVFRPESYKELERYVDELTESGRGAISIAVYNDGATVYEYASGLAGPNEEVTTESVFHWASITKLVTAVAVMQQVEEGTIDLDAPLDTYIPELPFASEITVRNALTHTTGLPAGEVNHLIGYGTTPLPSLESVLSDYVERVEELEFEPGTRPMYNNWNFLVLAVCVERATAREFKEYVYSEVLEPAGMTNTWFESNRILDGVIQARPTLSESSDLREVAAIERVHSSDTPLVLSDDGEVVVLNEFDILSCWGGLIGTAADATRFAAIFLGNGTVDGREILSRRSVRQMLTVQRSTDREPLPYGLALELRKDGRNQIAGHGGGGAGIETDMRFYPKEDIAVAVFGSMNMYGAGQIGTYVHDIAVGERSIEK